ncbi:hypothetical protein BGZ47_010354 [Haplosporangium gracile]|nr:hypothetical protein BGZ47_010354 [Haplosporangium gracile]
MGEFDTRKAIVLSENAESKEEKGVVSIPRPRTSKLSPFLDSDPQPTSPTGADHDAELKTTATSVTIAPESASGSAPVGNVGRESELGTENTSGSPTVASVAKQEYDQVAVVSLEDFLALEAIDLSHDSDLKHGPPTQAGIEG